MLRFVEQIDVERVEAGSLLAEDELEGPLNPGEGSSEIVHDHGCEVRFGLLHLALPTDVAKHERDLTGVGFAGDERDRVGSAVLLDFDAVLPGRLHGDDPLEPSGLAGHAGRRASDPLGRVLSEDGVEGAIPIEDLAIGGEDRDRDVQVFEEASLVHDGSVTTFS